MKRTENPAAVCSRITLIDALILLMREKDFHKIHIQEITETAELSRQTFYTNFTSKEDILKYSLQKLFEMMKERENCADFLSFI